jgi:hypothetical protein
VKGRSCSEKEAYEVSANLATTWLSYIFYIHTNIRVHETVHNYIRKTGRQQYNRGLNHKNTTVAEDF